MFEKLFKINQQGSSVKREVIAGITTFVTMVYIVFVNPAMLAEAGIDQGAAFVATCLAAAIGCFIMGFWANYPIALAPGMGLNAVFTYGVVLGMGYSWQSALAAVFFSGIIFLLLSLFKVREWIINAIPLVLKRAIATGIGAFLALIALKNSGIIVASPATLVQLGDISQAGPLLAIISFFFIISVIIEKIVNPNVPQGFSQLITVILFFSGVQILFLGVIGEYVGKILKNVNKENQYIISYLKKKDK